MFSTNLFDLDNSVLFKSRFNESIFFITLSNFLSKNKSLIIWFVIIAVVIYVILPDKQELQETMEAIKGADLKWLLVANIFYYITIPLYTIQLIVLSQSKLKAWVAFKVQMSVLFINKLLPSSISSFTMNSFYLYKNNHTTSQVASVIAMKALTSSITYTILFLVSLFIGIRDLNLIDQMSSTFDELVDAKHY